MFSNFCVDKYLFTKFVTTCITMHWCVVLSCGIDAFCYWLKT